MQNKTEEQKIRDAYMRMCDGMIAKDEELLDEVLDESFILLHMTGMKQNKKEFIAAVKNGTLNYYSAEHESMTVEINGDQAVLTGQSYVRAAVFGGGISGWCLQQKCTLRKTDDGWKITHSTAGIY